MFIRCVRCLGLEAAARLFQPRPTTPSASGTSFPANAITDSGEGLCVFCRHLCYTVASWFVSWKFLKNFLIKWLLSALTTPPFSPFSPYFCRGWGVNLGSLGFHLFPLSKAVPKLLRPRIDSTIFYSDQVSPFLLPILFVLVHNADKSPSSWRFASNLFRFPSPVLRVQYHPREEHEILVSPIRHAAVVVYLPEQPSSTTTATSTTTTQGAEHKLVPLDDEVISLMLRLKRLMNPNLIRPNIFLMQL